MLGWTAAFLGTAQRKISPSSDIQLGWHTVSKENMLQLFVCFQRPPPGPCREGCTLQWNTTLAIFFCLCCPEGNRFSTCLNIFRKLRSWRSVGGTRVRDAAFIPWEEVYRTVQTEWSRWILVMSLCMLSFTLVLKYCVVGQVGHFSERTAVQTGGSDSWRCMWWPGGLNSSRRDSQPGLQLRAQHQPIIK